MKYISIMDKPDGTFCPDISNIIFHIINYPIQSSYIIFFPRLFNLSYADFLRMVRDKYNATLTSKTGYMTFYFKSKQDCNLFVNECNKRFDLWRIL